MKRCKYCNKEFEPKFNAMQRVCSWKCALELTQKNKAKLKKQIWRKEKKEIKEKLKTNKDYTRELQVVFNTFIRLRDKNRVCISCQKPLINKYDAGHFYSVGAYPELRFSEANVHGQCVFCNQHKHGNLLEYNRFIGERIGLKQLKELEQLRGISRKYTKTELVELKDIYKKKIKELNNNV